MKRAIVVLFLLSSALLGQRKSDLLPEDLPRQTVVDPDHLLDDLRSLRIRGHLARVKRDAGLDLSLVILHWPYRENAQPITKTDPLDRFCRKHRLGEFGPPNSMVVQIVMSNREFRASRGKATRELLTIRQLSEAGNAFWRTQQGDGLISFPYPKLSEGLEAFLNKLASSLAPPAPKEQ